MVDAIQTKNADEKFCKSCGNIIKKEAVICVHCGVSVKDLAHSPPKDHTIAILLAVFLGFWTWLYTYKKDAWKFWTNLLLTFFSFGLWWFVAWIWAIIDVATKPQSYYQDF